MAWTASKRRSVLLDFLERAGWSAAQVFVATLLAGGTSTSVASLPWKYALILAGSAAAASAILTALQYLTKLTDLGFWADTVVRLAKTFISSVLASIAAADVFDVTKFDWASALNVAFLATMTALGKGLLAREPAMTALQTTQPADDRRPTDDVAQIVRMSPSTLPITTYVEAITQQPTPKAIAAARSR